MRLNTLPPLRPPIKEIDVGFLVFIERYATDLLKWDILTFFARHPDFCFSASKVANHIGRSVHSVCPELGDLVMLNILHQTKMPDGQTLYQLTDVSRLREKTLKFANLMVAANSG